MPELMQILEDANQYLRGYSSVRGAKSPDYEKKLVETINLLGNSAGNPSHVAEFLIREAMTTSDFPLLFGDVLDRTLLAKYKATPQVMEQLVLSRTVRDFRNVRRFRVNDGDGILPLVAEKAEYPLTDRDEVRYTYAVNKRGHKFDISWESIINDDLNALKDTPERFGVGARRSEEQFITELFWDADGPLDAFFSVANGGAAVSNLPLTIGNLETAVEEMSAFTDVNGLPILNRPKYLVIGPALEFTARQILTSTNKMWVMTGDADVAATAYPTNNVIAQTGLQLIINPFQPVVVTTGTIAATAWALFSDPGDLAAGEFGRLMGHEAPEIFMKDSNQRRVGGGEVSPMDGDFDTDNILYKVRHVFGGVTMDGRAGWASDGQ